MDQGALPRRVRQWLAAATVSRFKEPYDQGGELAQPRATGDRGYRRNAGDRAAGLRSGPHCQLTEEARGLTVSSAGVRCVWLRHDLERLKASEAKSARTARSDRGAGHRAGKSQDREEAHGEFESEHPG